MHTVAPLIPNASTYYLVKDPFIYIYIMYIYLFNLMKNENWVEAKERAPPPTKTLNNKALHA